MTELEKVEKLREKADVSFADAKEALEATEGDILDALIYLENQGKAVAPAAGGFYSQASAQQPEQADEFDDKNRKKKTGESFPELMKRVGRYLGALIRKGNNNFLEATKDDKQMFTCPVTVVAIFLIFFFWVTIPLYIVSLFFGFRYSFRGDELGRDSINRAMDKASTMVEEVKNTFPEHKHDSE